MRAQTIGPWALLCAILTAEVSHSADGLTIEEAVQQALIQNERSRIADEQSAAAGARVDKARSLFLPNLTLSGEYDLRGGRGTGGGRPAFAFGSPNQLSATATFNLTLFDARAFSLYRQTKLEQEAAQLGVSEERRRLALETADAFLQVLTAEQVRSATEQRLKFARRTVEDTRVRFDARLVGLNDMTRAELEVATAQREVISAITGVETARLRLGNLTGSRIEGPLIRPTQILEPPEPGDPNRLVQEARLRRPDVAAGRLRVKALDLFAREPDARTIPTLGLTSQYRETEDPGSSADRSDWFIGLNLTWRLYDGGERRADRLERRALMHAADFELKKVERHIDLEIRSAMVALENDRAVTRQAAVAAEIAHRNAEEAMALYGQGLASALEVADANLRRFEADVVLARARYGQALSWLNLRAALGGTLLEMTP